MSFRWLALRVEYLGNLIILLTGVFTTYHRESLSPGIAAMVVAAAVTMLVQWNFFCGKL